MNSDSPQKPSANLSLHQHEQPAADVPVFNCLVYVSPHDEGGVQARVGNLAGIAVHAPTEREALGKIVKEFKQRVAELTERGEEIAWIDPPDPPLPEEQTRFIPVHL